MAYGLKYSCVFDRLDSSGDTYTIQILQNNYAGAVTAITGGSTPVSHTWESDEPKAPIKGCSLAITIINEGGIPLSDFYSIDDQEFKVILTWDLFGGGSTTLYEGFIIQDDSSELMVDYNHEIALSSNDNLGLLKDVTLENSQAQPLFLLESITDTVDGQAPNFVQVSSTTYDKIIVGDTLVITSIGGVNGTFTVESKVVITSLYYLIFKEAVTNLPPTSSTIDLYKADMRALRPLASFIKSCLLSTGLTLNTRVFANINETSQTNTVCFLEQTFLDPQTFFNGNSWDDCYQVLTKILQRFNCTLFQAKGTWNIVRWDEARYYDYAVPGFTYDPDFAVLPAQALDESSLIFGGFPKFLIGVGEDSVAENGLRGTITRGFKFVKETFNYRQPAELLRNSNLNQLGNLITTYPNGPNTFTEYELPWWVIIPGSYAGTPEYFIRVVTDSLGNELKRGIVLRNGSIESYAIEANELDSFTYSFSVQTTNSQPGSVSIVFDIKLTDGVTTKYLRTDGTWGLRGYSVTVPTGDDTIQLHSFDISGTIPFDGILTMGLMDFDQSLGSTAGETIYTDIRMDYIYKITGSSKITGHTHKSEQYFAIKNTDDKEISIDTSPRNSIAGALFLNSLTGLLQTRAGQWKRSYAVGDKNLGEITTFENLFLRRIPRTLLEGTFHGLLSGGNHLSPLAVIKYTFFTDHNFIFGRLEIDYRNNSASGTLYEMYKGTETDLDLNYFYLFQYLYAAK